MKKITIILGLLALVGTAYGQGYVTVNGTLQYSTNNNPLWITYTGGEDNTGTFGAVSWALSGDLYDIALLTTTDIDPSTAFYLNPSAIAEWTNTGTIGGNGTFRGRLVIMADYQTAAGTAAVGTTQNWLLFGWSANEGSLSTVLTDLGDGYGWAADGFVGWSLVGTGAAGAAPPSFPLVITGTPTPMFSTGFTLEQVFEPVPEPGTLGLAALGGAALLLFRRKQ